MERPFEGLIEEFDLTLKRTENFLLLSHDCDNSSYGTIFADILNPLPFFSNKFFYFPSSESSCCKFWACSVVLCITFLQHFKSSEMLSPKEWEDIGTKKILQRKFHLVPQNLNIIIKTFKEHYSLFHSKKQDVYRFPANKCSIMPIQLIRFDLCHIISSNASHVNNMARRIHLTKILTRSCYHLNLQPYLTGA